MHDAEDQHHILLLRGTERGEAYPVVVAMHGQPRRGQAPRTYRFPAVVSRVAREGLTQGDLGPFVLVTPVFRFEGQNWPSFELGPFMTVVYRALADAGIAGSGLYIVGHSGAAGCGGAGLNQVAKLTPNAVGFFDTCVGSGFAQAVRALAAQRTPTLIVHSVETAGFVPRHALEYDADFDFGKVYAPLGLKAATCPEQLPAAPLRSIDYRCAKNDTGSTQAFVVNTGHGEAAHEALVPVALRYFLQRYVGRDHSSR
jgi:hypothetical protein